MEKQQVTTLCITVKGRVQGVGFRYFTQNEALKLRIKGSVKNVHNGDVEIIAQATDDQLNKFKTKLKSGPAFARVVSILEATIKTSEIYQKFEIKYE